MHRHLTLIYYLVFLRGYVHAKFSPSFQITLLATDALFAVSQASTQIEEVRLLCNQVCVLLLAGLASVVVCLFHSEVMVPSRRDLVTDDFLLCVGDFGIFAEVFGAEPWLVLSLLLEGG